MSDVINHNLTFISSFLCLCPVSAPLNHFPPGRCRHGQIVHRKELKALFSGFLQLLFFFNPSPSPVESCITQKKKQHLCVSVCSHNSMGPGFLESCATEWLSSFSLSGCTPFPPILAERRGRHSGGGTENRSKLFYLLFFPCPCSFSYVCFFCMTFFTLRLLFDTLSQLSKAWKAELCVSHTHIHTHTLSVPLLLPQSRGEVAPSPCHTATRRFCLTECF